jgi:protein-disulfide isomerase
MRKSEQLGSGIIIALILVQTVLLGLLVWRIRTVEERIALMQMSLREALLSPAAAEPGEAPVVLDVEPGDGPAKGATEPLVTIVEFSDFTCSACRQFQAALGDVLREYGDEVRLVYRYFPLAPDGKPLVAALAAECSRQQEAFWPMHDALFANARTLEGEEDVKRLAGELGLDPELFERCLASDEARAAVEADAAAGRSYGVEATPTVFVNGRRIRGAVSAAFLNQLIEGFKARQEEEGQQATAGAP